jgi:hypothetical protein
VIIDQMVGARVWSMLQPPWEKSAQPTLEAEFVRK